MAHLHTSAAMFFPPVSRAQSSGPAARRRVSHSAAQRHAPKAAHWKNVLLLPVPHLTSHIRRACLMSAFYSVADARRSAPRLARQRGVASEPGVGPPHGQQRRDQHVVPRAGARPTRSHQQPPDAAAATGCCGRALRRDNGGHAGFGVRFAAAATRARTADRVARPAAISSAPAAAGASVLFSATFVSRADAPALSFPHGAVRLPRLALRLHPAGVSPSRCSCDLAIGALARADVVAAATAAPTAASGLEQLDALSDGSIASEPSLGSVITQRAVSVARTDASALAQCCTLHNDNVSRERGDTGTLATAATAAALAVCAASVAQCRVAATLGCRDCTAHHVARRSRSHLRLGTTAALREFARPTGGLAVASAYALQLGAAAEQRCARAAPRRPGCDLGIADAALAALTGGGDAATTATARGSNASAQRPLPRRHRLTQRQRRAAHTAAPLGPSESRPL